MCRHALLAGCLAALAATSAPCAQAGLDNGAWARFEDPAGAAAARAIVASDLPGDAAIGSLGVDSGQLVVTGRLGDEHGSRWTTLGTEIAPPAGHGAVDLRGSTALRIQLASAVPRLLRVRLKGGDPQIANAGCYPVMIQQVTQKLVDYTIPLSAFSTPGWCGANAATVQQTLPAVERVEVTANDAPVGAVDFRIGHIDFLAEPETETVPEPATPAEADGRWRLAWGDDFDGAPGDPASPSRWQPDGDVSQDGLGHVTLRPRAGLRATPANTLQYGRVDVRLRLPAAGADGVAPGVRLALQGLAPDAGAIVMLESDPRGQGLATGVDGPGAAARAQHLRTPLAAPLAPGFHTVACEWEPDRIRWFVDGALAQESRRDELPAAAWAGIDRHPLVLAVSVDQAAADRRTAHPDPRAALVLDQVRLWQRDDAAAAPAPVLAGSRAAMPASPVTVATAAARRRPVAAPQQAAPPASTPSKHVVCEHSARYELMLCY